MARRPSSPKPVSPYEFKSYIDCEEAGLHRAEVKQWPPPRTARGEPDPFINARCTRCGVNLQVYEWSKEFPDKSGIEVVLVDGKAVKAAVATK